MNKRDTILRLVDGTAPPDYIPAAFFMHFDHAYHQGQPAIDKHLEYFRATGMDFVKIQYEQTTPPVPRIVHAEDWANAPRYTEEFFEPSISVAEGLVRAARDEALVIMTLYSPFMWAKHLVTDADLAAQLQENPAAVQKGLEIMTENVLQLVRGCKRVGVDGFYASSQGGEAFRFLGTDIFEKYIKPTDLRIWDEIRSLPLNVLHICDYEGGYEDLSPFLDYPGQIVNSSLTLGSRTLSPKEVTEIFGRPFMGGLERKGTIAHGTPEQVRNETERVLEQAPERFILAADCTVPSETPWENLKTAIETAHQYQK
jgi:uroporphyrinogen decarboxylase